jgi:hypothetical protein
MLLYLIGLVCTIWCILDIWKKNIKTSGKLITALVVFLTSWLGFLVYVLFARNRIEGWFK